MNTILNPGYYTEHDLNYVGFKKLGSNIKIARDAIFIGLENIELGSNIQIDSNVTFAARNGHLSLGSYIHIGGGSHLSCSGGINICDFVTISQGVKIYSASDDYSGEFMTNPTVPSNFTNVVRGEIEIESHVILGSGSVVLPGVKIRQGTAVGALSLVKEDTEGFSIYAGTPARKIAERSNKLLDLEAKLVALDI
jgi:galactoside O-acetyltransferase